MISIRHSTLKRSKKCIVEKMTRPANSKRIECRLLRPLQRIGKESDVRSLGEVFGTAIEKEKKVENTFNKLVHKTSLYFRFSWFSRKRITLVFRNVSLLYGVTETRKLFKSQPFENEFQTGPTVLSRGKEVKTFSCIVSVVKKQIFTAVGFVTMHRALSLIVTSQPSKIKHKTPVGFSWRCCCCCWSTGLC